MNELIPAAKYQLGQEVTCCGDFWMSVGTVIGMYETEGKWVYEVDFDYYPMLIPEEALCSPPYLNRKKTNIYSTWNDFKEM